MTEKPVKKKKKRNVVQIKFNEKLLDKICAMIGMGSYIETAFKANGINNKTLYDWLDKCHNGHPLYKNVAVKIEQAVAKGELRDLHKVDQASKRDWRAATWKLARRHPERWAKKEYVEANVTEEKVEKVSAEEKKALVIDAAHRLVSETAKDDGEDFE